MKSPRKSAILAGLAVMIASAGLVPAAVAAPNGTDDHPDSRTVHVSGDQKLINFTPALSVYAMEGDLVGQWLLQPVGPPLYVSKTFYAEAGQETFTGCVDRNRDGKCGKRDRRGTMNTTYLYWASFESDGVTLVKGQCVHPVTGGTGAFTGARGVLNMYDRLVGDEVQTTYRGNIVFNAVDEEAVPPVVTLPQASARTLAASGSTSLRKGC